MELPALRDRREDIPLLANHLLSEIAADDPLGKTPQTLSRAALDSLMAHEWPGNVRELRNVIERAFITCREAPLLRLDPALPEATPPGGTAAPPAEPGGEARILTVTELKGLEGRNIERALAAAKGRISGPAGAAALLGLNPSTLASRMKALGVHRRHDPEQA